MRSEFEFELEKSAWAIVNFWAGMLGRAEIVEKMWGAEKKCEFHPLGAEAAGVASGARIARDELADGRAVNLGFGPRFDCVSRSGCQK
jgi:hypothetical protein